MPVKSMTGFGRAAGRIADLALTVEIRTVNHKHTDVRCTLPPLLQRLDAEVVAYLRAQVGRGSVRCEIFLEEREGAAPRLDAERARALLSELRRLGKSLDIPTDLTLRDLLALPGLFRSRPDAAAPAFEKLEPLLAKAVRELLAVRAREGRALGREIEGRARGLEKELQALRRLAPRVLDGFRDRIRARLEEWREQPGDPVRVAQEIAIMAEKLDVAEELSRIAVHLDHLREILRGSEPAGRKADFILQELFREFTTLANKSQSAEMSRKVIECKTELEKIREQVQNLE